MAGRILLWQVVCIWLFFLHLFLKYRKHIKHAYLKTVYNWQLMLVIFWSVDPICKPIRQRSKSIDYNASGFTETQYNASLALPGQPLHFEAAESILCDLF